MAVAIDKMRGHLLTLEQAREKLAATEPLAEYTFPASSGVEFQIEDSDWAKKPLESSLNAFIRTGHALQGGKTYQLTKQGLLEAGAACGLPRKYQERLPQGLLTDQLNYWFQGGLGDKEFKLLTVVKEQGSPGNDDSHDGLVLAMCRGTITPFSNLSMLNTMLEGVESRYGSGSEVLVDYKLSHGLEDTRLRLVFPDQAQEITGTRDEGDAWSLGLDYYNSLVGLHPTNIAGYLFRWICTNGSTDVLAASGSFSRRGTTSEDEALDWARTAVDDALGGLEHAFEDVQALTAIPVEAEVSVILRDLFAQYSIPQRERQRVLDNMADLGGELTMYDIQNAITMTANLEGLAPRAVSQLLEMGGHVLHAATGRCQQCRRLLPEGYTPPAAIAS